MTERNVEGKIPVAIHNLNKEVVKPIKSVIHQTLVQYIGTKNTDILMDRISYYKYGIPIGLTMMIISNITLRIFELDPEVANYASVNTGVTGYFATNALLGREVYIWKKKG